MCFHVQLSCQLPSCVTVPELGRVDTIWATGPAGRRTTCKPFGRAVALGVSQIFTEGYRMKSSSDSESSFAALASVIS